MRWITTEPPSEFLFDHHWTVTSTRKVASGPAQKSPGPEAWGRKERTSGGAAGAAAPIPTGPPAPAGPAALPRCARRASMPPTARTANTASITAPAMAHANWNRSVTTTPQRPASAA
jgi:hypothetical protein